MHKSGNRQFRDTNSHEQKQEHWLCFFFLVILLNYFKPILKLTVCLVNAMQAVVTEGVTVGGSMPVTHKQTKKHKNKRSGGNKNTISDG